MPLFNFLQDIAKPQTQGLFAAPPGMMPTAAPEAPRAEGSFLGDLMRSTIPGQALEKVRQDRALKELASRMQRGELSKEQAGIEYAGITGDYSAIFGTGSQGPMALQEWQKFSAMSPADQKRYLIMKRSGQTIDLGGSQAVLDPVSGGIAQEYDKTLKPEDQPENIAAGKQAEVTGKVQGERSMEVGKAQQNAQYMLSTIDKLLNPGGGLAPGAESVVGGFMGMQGRQSSVFPVTENQRRFQPMINQIKGQTFLRAYETLKGGGQITEVEGQKAESAMARLDQAQDEKSFEDALRELRGVIEAALARTVQEAGGSSGLIGEPSADQKMQGWGAPRTVKFGDLK